MKRFLIACLMGIFTALGGAALAQGTGVSLGGLSVDPSAPVEITSGSFTVDQKSGVAVFSDNVRVGQGNLRLAADRVEVIYRGEAGEIARLKASGGVTFVTATEAAEAASADYDLDGNRLTLMGNVLLSQGQTAISGDRMVVNLATGQAQVTGNVKTVLGGAQ